MSCGRCVAVLAGGTGSILGVQFGREPRGGRCS